MGKWRIRILHAYLGKPNKLVSIKPRFNMYVVHVRGSEIFF